jgi:hypothetical protein
MQPALFLPPALAFASAQHRQSNLRIEGATQMSRVWVIPEDTGKPTNDKRRCNAVSTDTMHRMKFNEGVDGENVSLAYYNSISFAFTEICGRSYGGGVLESLPGEMGNIMLSKVEEIDPAFRCNLLGQIDTMICEKDNIEKALDIVDKEVLINILGIEEDICKHCRTIWKKLQKRRLGSAK